MNLILGNKHDTLKPWYGFIAAVRIIASRERGKEINEKGKKQKGRRIIEERREEGQRGRVRGRKISQ